MDIPHTTKFGILMQQGGGVFASLGSGKERFYFVLNLNPASDEYTILLSSTTDFESHKECNPACHVHLNKSRYPDFTCDRLICTNWDPTSIPKKKFDELLQRNGYKLLHNLSPEIIEELRVAVAESETLTRSQKNKILGDDNL